MKAKFEVRFTPRFLKNIKALDKEVQVRIIREINILKTDPYVGKPLRGEWKGIYSLRIGITEFFISLKLNAPGGI
ncbi:MAG: hypothetical protein QHH12_07420 [Candidatus Bathyarchaeota archaeon]|nr:hypothetical protein [Candidatus Bathyarchaeota archaeon A05DMB-3]MDH7607568.1 hypothetical protein [Candidatus Bathyarchaeota archaeon]